MSVSTTRFLSYINCFFINPIFEISVHFFAIAHHIDVCMKKLFQLLLHCNELEHIGFLHLNNNIDIDLLYYTQTSCKFFTIKEIIEYMEGECSEIQTIYEYYLNKRKTILTYLFTDLFEFYPESQFLLYIVAGDVKGAAHIVVDANSREFPSEIVSHVVFFESAIVGIDCPSATDPVSDAKTPAPEPGLFKSVASDVRPIWPLFNPS